MLLIKCSCGCFFTLKEQGLDNTRAKKCQNCGLLFELDKYTNFCTILDELSPKKLEVSQIPDDAKISVSYTL